MLNDQEQERGQDKQQSGRSPAPGHGSHLFQLAEKIVKASQDQGCNRKDQKSPKGWKDPAGENLRLEQLRVGQQGRVCILENGHDTGDDQQADQAQPEIPGSPAAAFQKGAASCKKEKKGGHQTGYGKYPESRGAGLGLRKVQ